MEAKEFTTLRSVLADDVSFRGPLGTADDADTCMHGLRGMAEIITDIEIHKTFADGPDVLTWFDLHSTVAPAVPDRELEPHGGRKDQDHPRDVRRACPRRRHRPVTVAMCGSQQGRLTGPAARSLAAGKP